MARILIFDDNLRIRDEMLKHIKKINAKHEISTCADCSSVLFELERNEVEKRAEYSRFILDLNANTIGLTDSQAGKTQNGLRTGWVVLMEVIMPRTEDALDKVVFFSGWLKQLSAYVQSEDASEKEKEVYESLKKQNRFINKTDGYNSLDPFLCI